MSKNRRVTVAVITCRRPEWLKRLLNGLNKQVVSDDIEVQFLVVDNALDSKTEQVVTEFAGGSNYPVLYRTEPEPGIVAARNKCVSEFLAGHDDYLIFIDDDEWPEQDNWIETLVIQQESYDADCMTSHVISVGEEGTPPWAVQLIYGKNNLIEGDQVGKFYTNNLLICRHVLENISPAFDSRFAMTGSSDYHFSLKARKAGYKTYYTNAPVVEEFPKSRATIKWFLRRGFRSGIGYTRSHLFEENTFQAILKCSFMAGVRFIRGIFYGLLGALTLNKTESVNGLFRICSAAGTIAGFFGVKHHEYKTIHGK